MAGDTGVSQETVLELPCLAIDLICGDDGGDRIRNEIDFLDIVICSFYWIFIRVAVGRTCVHGARGVMGRAGS